MLETKCHCGAVRIAIPRRPRVLTACNCSMCRRLQPLFAYYVARSLNINHPPGALQSYIWGKGVLRWHRCKTCGCFTHHCRSGHEANMSSRVGVNLRLCDPMLLRGIVVKVRDGMANTWDVVETCRLR